jgi:hypothetical protein
MDTTLQPFGVGPWPCLSPICDYRHQPVIEQVPIGISRKAQRQAIGTFTCPHCGYTYRRAGRDTSPDDQLRGKVLAYGPLWDDKLRHLSQAGHLNQKQLAAAMGVGVDTLKRQLQRLTAPPASTELSHMKTQWLEIIRESSDLGTADLIAQHSDLYWQIHRFDADWLAAHALDTRRPTRHSRRDWQQLDSELSAQVADAVAKIRSQTQPARRITRNAIGIRLGWPDGSIHKSLGKLPLIATELERHIETHEDFAVRRVWLMHDRCIRDKHKPTRANFIKQCGLSRSVQTPSVLRAVADAWSSLPGR